MNRILITGANGFIGQSLCRYLIKKNKFVRGVVRDKLSIKNSDNIQYVSVGDINFKTNWMYLLSDIDCIIHCAGKTHSLAKKNIISDESYKSVNIDGTKQLAIKAAEAGVKRMIFLSSIKVNGENTDGLKLNEIDGTQHKFFFTHTDEPAPKDIYGLSKWNAEKELWKVSAKTNLKVNILRLPLVYGAGVKGNLNRLLRLVHLGIPLPFGLIKNNRSMIALDNLIDLINRCIDHPDAVGKTFLVSDGDDLSTPQLIKLMASYMGRSASLFPVPISFLKAFGYFFNKSEEINKLVGSLRVDNSFTCKILNWSPQINVSEGIKRMVQSEKF